TTADAGVLFWHGQGSEESGKGKDYLALVINDGRVTFTYELGSGPANITTPVKVNDGRSHTIVARRSGKYGSLEVDGFSFVEGESSGNLQMLNTKGNIYMGGLPDADLMTNGRFTSDFIGCIMDIFIQDTGPLDLGKEVISGSNVRRCEV
ncbi:hypothetical protein CAPTEDRAFT_90339, partial [Capitella teleta]